MNATTAATTAPCDVIGLKMSHTMKANEGAQRTAARISPEPLPHVRRACQGKKLRSGCTFRIRGELRQCGERMLYFASFCSLRFPWNYSRRVGFDVVIYKEVFT
jgi:hypothetical protein